MVPPAYHLPVTVDAEIRHMSCSPPNNSCVLDDKRCCQIVTKTDTYVNCVVFGNTEPVYTDPIDSRIIGIHKVRITNVHRKRLPLDTSGGQSNLGPLS